MRRFIQTLVLVFICQITFAQNFYYPSGMKQSSSGMSSGLSSQDLVFQKNQANDAIYFKWKVLSVDTNLVAGTGASVSFGVCDNKSCYASFVGNEYVMDEVPIKSTYGKFKFQAFAVNGEARICALIRVWDRDNPAAEDTVEICWKTDNWVSLDESYLEVPELSVYPNPATNNINVSYDLKDASKVSFELVSVLGKSVYRKELNDKSGNLDLNVEKLPRGVYFYAIKNQQGKTLLTKKLVLH